MPHCTRSRPPRPAVNAACINTPGGYTCQCHLTYTGNGQVCVADVAAQDAVAAKFETNTPPTESKFGFTPVAYPVNAPGFAYDPTGGWGHMGCLLATISMHAQPCLRS